MTTVQNGLEGLEQMEREPFDVVVVDLNMPGMTGDILCEKIKQRCRGLPVIILTGYGDSRRAGRLSNVGIYYYLRKPCDIENLVTVARQAADDEWRKWFHRLNIS